MIPPLAPGQLEENENMVRWKNTFDMRQVTLLNLATSNLSLRTNSRSQLVFNRMRNGCVSSPTKSLDILRKNLQSAINRDIEAVIKKYLEKFFQPAIENIRNNLGRESVNEDHVKDVCRQILEEAKQIYSYNSESRDSSPYECSDSETGSLGLLIPRSPAFRKRKESDTDSENSQSAQQKRVKIRNASGNGSGSNSSPSRFIRFEGPKWNPERITSCTLFIMGARANKVLGYGQTRGRLYVRHPDLMRYSGDQEDKDWLSRHNLLPANGGKAYLMVLEDIKELARMDEYRNSPNLLLTELKGFEVPQFMINKIRSFMDQVRSESKIANQLTNFDLYDLQNCSSETPPCNTMDSGSSTPSETLNILDNNVKSSDLNLYINAPEISPESNSFLVQSPVSNTLLNNGTQNLNYSTNDLISRQCLQRNSLSSIQHNTLSAFFSGQLSSDNSQDDSEF